ncbi:uroporphyrinogen-III C-methyltransferase [Selenomonas sp. oral taxon 892 str. F0426]|uniref:uroporphyrinogen-III C-methyltransferase n=1 Tax=Selenomonas sp. oral taxon 892 TaxID=1321785 RepID=UPI0003AD29BF|nr:uroporphyrinogen-III C-methyltransferase [Selenomonas sp. oral taxon 892]ERJ92778.1 uroporphyrinogen-III C-methyltransferase [Selenomonas sp. oral taxon 892 str. F0426]
MSGKVFLVGAGPGDPRLLTVGAMNCLRKADVVVYDHLADESILSYVPPTAERIYVGKQSRKHTMQQEDINVLLADKADEGKTVVRLKGGDPFVFGRGGEEALVLLARGIPFEVLPGVTSAISVPAYAGIPVTHRGVAVSFAVITGHEDPTKSESHVQWKHLATGVDTLVFLMGVANLPVITKNLIAYGRPADTPAAIIRWGTRPNQETYVTTLGEAAAMAERDGIRPPAIFIVGEVVNLRDQLRWFDRADIRPLHGKNILVTRARAQASALTEKLTALGASCIEAPVIRIAPPADNYAALDRAIGELHTYHWLIFTSVNGAEHFFSRLHTAGKDSRALGYAKVAAIGSATAKALCSFGIHADIVPEEFRAEALVDALVPILPPRARILLARAQEARDVLPESLRSHGAAVDVIPAYETVLEREGGEELAEQLMRGEIDVVTFTSSSTVKNLVRQLGNITPLQHTKIACIGPVTAETARSFALEPDIVAENYTIDGLVHAIREYVQ